MNKKKYQWANSGDVNAFFGLMLDNVADLLLMVGLLAGVFQFPTDFAFRYMVPGTAIGVLVGDLVFFWMAIRLAKRTGRNDITAMPLGLDTPSTFGMVFFVLGPAYLHGLNGLGLEPQAAAKYAWQIGICAIVVSGLFKIACAFCSNSIRDIVPRAGLLGSLASIALVLISFLPLIEIMHAPVVGFLALAIILTTLVGRIHLPFKTPGALGALFIAGAVYHLMAYFQVLHVPHSDLDPSQALLPSEWVSVFDFSWTAVLNDSMRYMPIVIPFALATVVGGIDCTESAAAAGDEFDTGQVVGVEAVATLIAGLCGGVIQTTPYIGHPAYKAMGGRAAYVLATAIFVGSAGLIGFFGYLYLFIPKPAIFPILVFIGLEITAQSFAATPKRHYKAVAIACVPALAYLSLFFVDQISGAIPDLRSKLSPKLVHELLIVQMLANGFILTSVIWASSLAAIIDKKLKVAGIYFGIAAVFCAFGVMHSPLPGNAVFWPWNLDATNFDMVIRFCVGYVLIAVLMIAYDKIGFTSAADEDDFTSAPLDGSNKQGSAE